MYFSVLMEYAVNPPPLPHWCISTHKFVQALPYPGSTLRIGIAESILIEFLELKFIDSGSAVITASFIMITTCATEFMHLAEILHQWTCSECSDYNPLTF